MKLSFVVALVGLALAVVDFSGAARWVEAQVRPAMHGLLRGASWLLDKGTTYSNWVAVCLLGVAAVLVVAQLSGFDLGPYKPDGRRPRKRHRAIGQASLCFRPRGRA